MASLKKKMRLWQQELWAVACKPSLLFPLVIVGFFMLWLAGEQVRLTFYLFGHSNLVSGRLSKFKYLVYGVFILAYIWLDLLLVRYTLAAFNSVIRSYQHMAHNATETPSDTSILTRKNPTRACRKVY